MNKSNTATPQENDLLNSDSLNWANGPDNSKTTKPLIKEVERTSCSEINYNLGDGPHYVK